MVTCAGSGAGLFERSRLRRSSAIGPRYYVYFEEVATPVVASAVMRDMGRRSSRGDGGDSWLALDQP